MTTQPSAQTPTTTATSDASAAGVPPTAQRYEICPDCGEAFPIDDPGGAPDPRAAERWGLTPLGQWYAAEELPRLRRLALVQRRASMGETLAALPTATRAHLRDLVREFLSSTPESEPDARLELPWPDGALYVITRGQLAERARWLRPRMRRIIEQRHVRHFSRGQVIAQLGCSMKTLERDECAALDLLIAEATADA